MKRRFFSIIFTVIGLAVLAQTPVVAQQPAYTSDYRFSTRAWTAGPLEWDEFKGHPKSDTTAVKLSWMFRRENTLQRQGSITYHYSKIVPYLDMTESWLQPILHSETSLKMCQTAFDMLELYGRRATREYNCNQESDFSSIEHYFNKEYEQRLKDMVFDTRQGTDAGKVDLYATQVQLELESEQFDASQVPLGESQLYVGLGIGLHTMAAFSDYFGYEPIGIAWDLDFGYKRHLWMIDMALCFGGECRRDVETSHGWIHEGDGVQAGYMMLNWGYQLSRDLKHPCWPFVGVGVTFFDGTVAEYVDKNGRDITPEKAGFTLAAGLVYDVPLRRHVYLRSNDQVYGIPTNNVSHYGLRLKPSVSFAVLSGIGWVPCLNLGVSFDMTSWVLK